MITEVTEYSLVRPGEVLLRTQGGMDFSTQMAVLALQRKGINVALAELEPLKVVAITACSSIFLYKMVQFVRLSEEGMLVSAKKKFFKLVR